jgi:hypothetical protein
MTQRKRVQMTPDDLEAGRVDTTIAEFEARGWKLIQRQFEGDDLAGLQRVVLRFEREKE